MSKKRERKRQRGRAAEEPAGERAARRASRRSGRGEFNPDYSYVRKDLRRIAILAGFFLAVLLILAVVLN